MITDVPLLMSLVKSTSISVEEGQETGVKKDFQAVRELRHGLCMCSIQRVNEQDKLLKCL